MTRLLRPGLTILPAGLLVALAGCSDLPLALRPPQPAVQIVAVGDSATRGPAAADWTAALAVEVGLPDRAIANEGVGGETSTDGVMRLAGLINADIFPNADTLLFWEGGNEVIDFVQQVDPLLVFNPARDDYPFDQALAEHLDHLQADLEHAVDLGRAAGWRVFLLTYYPVAPDVTCPLLPPALQQPSRFTNITNYVALVNDRVRAAAAATGAGLVDIADLHDELLADPATYYYNCTHLSAAGNELVAAEIARVLATAP